MRTGRRHTPKKITAFDTRRWNIKKSVTEMVIGNWMCVFLQSDPAAASTSLVGICSCNNFCLVIVVRERENDPSGQTYLYRIIYSGQTHLYRIIYRHSQILANTPNIMGTLSSIVCPRNKKCITLSKTFSLRAVYSKPLGGKTQIVKLARGLKNKFFFFFFLPEPYCSYKWLEIIKTIY